MWIGVLWAGLRVAMWIAHVGGKFRHGLLEKSLNFKRDCRPLEYTEISSPPYLIWKLKLSRGCAPEKGRGGPLKGGTLVGLPQESQENK